MQVCCPICETQIKCETVQVTDATLRCPNCESIVDLQNMVAGVSISMSMDSSFDDKTRTVTFASKSIEEGSFVGKFQILKVVGQGGFGSVYKAYDRQLERVVALKVPRGEANSQLDAEAFLREAQMAASVRDPNIVAVHEVGQDDGTSYICSEFIDGCTLKEWFRQEDRPLADICRMIVRVAKSLEKAHQTGLVHRDLKPANILVDHENNPFITDFGLARKFVTGPSGPDAGKIEIVGTPAYMSPEQAVGDISKINSKTDIYSLGVMLYELAVNKRPFVGEVASIIQDILYHDPPRPSESNNAIPKPLEAIILKAMSKNQDERFESSLEFAEDIERFLRGEPTLSLPLTRNEYFAYQLRKNRVAVGVATFLIFAIGITYWVSTTFFKEDPVVVEKKVAAEIPTVQVRIETRPARANIAIVPIDPKTRIPLRDKVIQPDGFTPLDIELPAGDYFVEVYVPNLGVQEVRRSVSDIQVAAKEPIQFRAIDLLPLTADLPLVEGGTFEVSYEAGGLHVQERTVDSFYIQPTEVTHAEFVKVMGRPPELFESLNQETPYQDDFPVSRFTFLEALEFAEKIGMRLIDFEEFCYAATNKGTSGVPWGELDKKEDVQNYWAVAPVKHYKIDSTLAKTSEKPIYGLFSNVPELTGTTIVPQILLDQGYKGLEDAITIVGQPSSFSGENRGFFELPCNASHFGSKPMDGFYQMNYPVGFRCVRSANPRYIDLTRITN